MGNRVAKKLRNIENEKVSKTFYARDAQGNVLSIYETGKEKVYRDENGKTYYFDDDNQLIKIIDENGNEQDITNITGKLFFENVTKPKICIKEKPSEKPCQKRVELYRQEHIYTDNCGAKYYFNEQNQLISIEGNNNGATFQSGCGYISQATGQALILEEDRYYLCLDEKPCQNKIYLEQIDEFTYHDDKGNQYTFNAQNQLISVINKANIPLLEDLIGEYLVFEKDRYYLCVDKIQCKEVISLTDITDLDLLTQTEVPIYGSDRIGTYNPPSPEDGISNTTFIQYRGYKRYELKDHLGNVRVTVSDSKKLVFNGGELILHAEIKTYTDYYPFGMEMVGRAWSEGEMYRFGHNGQEKSREIGEDNYTPSSLKCS